jgi:chemotaxis protein MotB
MIQKLLYSAAAAVLLCSCGGGKKLESANAQIGQLQANNKALTRNVDESKKQVADLTSANSALKSQFESCQQATQSAEEKLRSAQTVVHEEREKLQRVQDKLNEGMADFESKGVDIFMKDGDLHVSMADKLLYKTGSSVLSKEGKDALVHLAEVLNGYPNMGVIVLGNTDSVLFKNGRDNWTLSTERANGVIRVLRDSNVDPARLTAAGKGRYNPVADNSTAEGRAKNRRTDIILNPDVQKFWESMDK